MKRLLAIICCCVFALIPVQTAGLAHAEPAVVQIFIAPDGDDATGDGTRQSPFATLRQANTHLESVRPDTPVEVLLQPGEYLEVGTRWTYVPQQSLTIAARSGIATFNGENDYADYILKIWPLQDRASMKLRLTNLRFTEATNGLQLKSLRDVVVDSVQFDHLGTHYSPAGTGYAALSIQNVSQVTVNDPTFSNLINSADQQALIHAIYAANDADDVTVNDVSINRVSGDPLRFRNGSDSFHIRGGTTRNAGTFTAFSEWFDQTRDEARSYDARLINVDVSARGFDAPLQIGRTACFQRFTLDPVDPCYISDLP